MIKADVERSLAASSGPAAAAALPPAKPAIAVPTGATAVRLDTMRKTIARRMVQSKQEVPHFRVAAEIELDAALALRKTLNAEGGAGARLSLNDLLIKACALSLTALPETNATWAGDGSTVFLHEHAHIAVAVAVEGGLMTPVVKQADLKPLSAISQEMKDFAARAKDRKLMPEDYEGGTFSLSNLGMYGVDFFDAIINPPQAMILAVGAGKDRLVPGKDGAPRVAHIMRVTLACDHRMVDGALGARWLQRFKRLMEKPEALAE